MIVLNTRPEPDNQVFADACRKAGLKPIACPVMTIDILETAIDLTGVGALAFTSANGVRAVAVNDDARDLPVFAVGEATAVAARDAGFQLVRAAGGDVETLANLIAEEHRKENGLVFHGAGDRLAGDLVELLTQRKVRARKSALYRARPSNALPEKAVEFIRNGEFDWAVFFSPRTAELFGALALKAGVSDSCRAVAAACLSDNVAAAASVINWRKIAVPSAKNSDAIIALMKKTP